MNKELQDKINQAKDFITTYLDHSDIRRCMLFSGGKDSVVLRHLIDSCGITGIDYYYSASGMEGEHLVKFIKENYPDVIWIEPKKPVLEEWKERKYLPYPVNVMNKTPTTTGSALYCCFKNRYPAKDVTLSSHNYDMIINGAKSTDISNANLYTGQITMKHNKTFLSPLYFLTDDDIYAYIKEHYLSICEEYQHFNITYTCPICPLMKPGRAEKVASVYPELISQVRDIAYYCYDNNPYLQEQFKDKEEYYECCTDKDKYRDVAYNKSSYFIDPETGMKYDNKTYSAVM